MSTQSKDPSSSSSTSNPTTIIPEFPYPPPIDSTWHQVTEFPSSNVNDSNLGDDDDEGEGEGEEWIEEVEYITFDFGHSHAPSPISSYSSFQLLGLNTDRPFLKIGNQIYRGEYESLIGTELIMKPVVAKGDHRGEQDPSRLSYEPMTDTRSRIRWLPVSLLPNSSEADGAGSEPESSSPEDLNGTDSKLKRRLGASAGGRHWASHWTKFTPRPQRPQHTKTLVNPDPSTDTT